MSRQIVLTTAEGVELEFLLAGVGSRFVAAFIDALLQVLIALLLVVIGALSMHVSSWYASTTGIWLAAVLIVCAFLIIDGYYVFFETMWNGQTPGKRSLGLRVLRDDGFPIDFRGALIRNAMRIVDFMPGLYTLGALCIFLNGQHRRLGDMVAGTIVVREKDDGGSARIDVGYTWQASAAPTVEGAYLPVEALTPAHFDLVETFLRRRSQLEPATRARMAGDIAGRVSAQMQIPPRSMADELLLEEVMRTAARRAGLTR